MTAWTTQPPAEVWRAVVDAAEHASRGEEALSAAALLQDRLDPLLLAQVGVRLLAGVLAEGVDADELRHGVLDVAAQTGAGDPIVVAALEVIAMSEALVRGDLEALRELCTGTQLSAQDQAVVAAALAGQAIAHEADDPLGVFERLRAQYGGG